MYKNVFEGARLRCSFSTSYVYIYRYVYIYVANPTQKHPFRGGLSSVQFLKVMCIHSSVAILAQVVQKLFCHSGKRPAKKCVRKRNRAPSQTRVLPRRCARRNGTKEKEKHVQQNKYRLGFRTPRGILQGARRCARQFGRGF